MQGMQGSAEKSADLTTCFIGSEPGKTLCGTRPRPHVVTPVAKFVTCDACNERLMISTGIPDGVHVWRYHLPLSEHVDLPRSIDRGRK